MTRYQEGYLFKRGKRPVWVARWREVILRNGKEVVRHRARTLGLVERMSHRQARIEMQKVLKPLNDGTYSPEGSLTLSQFVDSWMVLVFPNFKPSTQHGYKTLLRTHVLPQFGDFRLADICKRDIQLFVARKISENLKWQTVRNCWILLSSVLNSACEYDYISTNPAKGVKFPPEPPKKAPEILTAWDLERLLAEMKEPFRTMAQLCVLTGLRIGELCALQWEDVDLRSSRLLVRRGVYEGQFHSPKGGKVRLIPLSPLAAQILAKAYAEADKFDLVFHTRTGRPYREGQIGYRYIRPAAERAGLGRVTAHHLRHIHSSVLHDQGTPIGIIQKQLGHSRVETTLNTYTHIIPETHRLAIERLEQRLFPNCAQVTKPKDKRELVN